MHHTNLPPSDTCGKFLRSKQRKIETDFLFKQICNKSDIQYLKIISKKKQKEVEKYLIDNRHLSDTDHLPFGIFSTLTKGKDIFTFCFLPKNTPTYLYKGIKIKCKSNQMNDNHTLDCNTHESIIGDRSSLGALTNHSCYPNLKPYEVKYRNQSFILFKTIHDIQPLTSLKWCYNNRPSKDERLFYPFLSKTGKSTGKCMCSACKFRYHKKHPNN